MVFFRAITAIALLAVGTCSATPVKRQTTCPTGDIGFTIGSGADAITLCISETLPPAITAAFGASGTPIPIINGSCTVGTTTGTLIPGIAFTCTNSDGDVVGISVPGLL